MFVGEHEGMQVFFLLFSGMAAGFIGAWLLWIFWWTERKKQLEDKGNELRAKIQARFDRLHDQVEHKN